MDQNMKEILQRVKVGAATAAEAVSRVADAASQKAGELADTTKLNLQLFDKTTELEALFKELGKIVYLTHTGVEVEEQELEMAKLLIQNMTKAFDAEEYRDEYQARLRDAIMKKIQGQEIVTADTSGPDNVIDLMEALKKSLDMTKKDSPGHKSKRGTA